MFLSVACLVIISGHGAGSSQIDDFEWITPIAHPVFPGYLDYTFLCSDEATGEVYTFFVNQTPEDDNASIECHRFNHSNLQFERIGSIMTLTGQETLCGVAIHKGVRFFLYTDQDTGLLHVSSRGSVDRNIAIGLPYHFSVKFLGVHDDLLQLELERHDRPGYTYTLCSIETETLNWTVRALFACNLQSSVMDRGSLIRDGIYYKVMASIEYTEPDSQPQSQAFYWTHDLERNVSHGPTTIFKLPNNESRRYYANFDFDLDSRGDFHIFFGDFGRLSRYSPQGALLATTLINPLANNNTRWNYGIVVLNQSDCVNVIGDYLFNDTYGFGGFCSVTIDREYASSPVFKVIESRGVYIGIVGVGCLLNRSDNIHFMFQVQPQGIGHMETHLTYQIPPSPDLAFDPASYRFVEDEGVSNPISISLDVENVGRAVARQYHVIASYRLANDTDYEVLGDIAGSGPLPGAGRSHIELKTRMPRGAIWIRFVILDVSPYENIRTNNAFEAIAYVQGNTPPELEITSPENGTIVTARIRAAGIASDLDGDPMTVLITGPPGFDLTVPAFGNWSAELDFSHASSGDYWLSFVAFDGMEYSQPTHRLVRIDQPSESLVLVSAWPSGDVELLVGREQAFLIDVKERLSRQIWYNWTVDGAPAGGEGSHYVYSAFKPGELTIAVGVSSNLTSLSHSWRVHVRAVRAPTLVAVKPEPQSSIGKGTSLEFVIDQQNPDSFPCSLIWTLDDVILKGLSGESCVRRFTEGGNHTVSAILSWGSGQTEVAWDIKVINSPPRITSWFPNASIRIQADCILNFSISAEDADGDVLTYIWEAMNLEIDPGDTSSLNASCPYVPSLNRTVRVTVSDGEESIAMVWDIESTPKDATEPVEPPSTAPDMTWIILALILAVVAAVTVGYYLGTRRRD